MPPQDIKMTDRQRAVDHMQARLQSIGQPVEKAAALAARVEEAVYKKANSREEYAGYLQNSLAKAVAAQQKAQAMAQQGQMAGGMAQQAQVMQQQGAAPRGGGGGAAQYGMAGMAQTAPGNMQYMHQQTAAAPPQQMYGMNQHNMPQQQHQQHQQQQQQQQAAQYMGMAQAQPQQQYMQAQQQQQPVQYMQPASQAQAAHQQYVRQPQQQYMQAPVAQQQYMQAQPQVQYVQQQVQAQPQQQYMQQAAQPQQQYVQQQARPQQQYMQQPAAVQPQYMQAQAQQQYVQQQPVQQQYMQQQAQPQQQYVQQPTQPQQQYVQQPSQPQYVQNQQQQGYVQPAAQPQQQYMQQPAQPQQQYVAQARGGGYTVQQYGNNAAPAVQPQAVQQQPIQAPVQQLPIPGPPQQAAPSAVPQALRPSQLTAGDLARLPSFDDPIFSDFAAELFPSEAQAAPAAPPPPPRFAAQPQASAGDSSKGSPAALPSNATQQRYRGGSRPLAHEPAALQEFMRLHAIINLPEQRTKAKTVRPPHELGAADAERMLQFYRDTSKLQPARAEQMAIRVQRYSMLLRLLLAENPHHQISITDSVVSLTKNFIRDLGSYREVVKKSHQKAAAGKAAAGGGAAAAASMPPPAASAPSPGGAFSPGGFLAMMESADSEGLRLHIPSATPPGSAAASAGATPAATPTQQAAQQPSAAAEAARQQALLRQRQLQEQRRREAAAAAAAAAPLPADAQQRLLAVSAQPRGQQDAAAIQAGFRRLQKVLQAADQRQLGTAAQPVSTPPLPAEARRLVARDKAALEAAVAAAGGAGSGAAGLVTAAAGHGFVEQQAAPGAGSEGGAYGEPAAKRQRSGSPEAGAAAGAAQPGQQPRGQGPRAKSELERRLAVECEEAAAALGGALWLLVAPDSSDPGAALVTCVPKAARGEGNGNGGGGGGGVADQQRWQVLMLRVAPGYPGEPPTAVFPRLGHGGASAAKAAAAEQQQLLDACRERFAAGVAAEAQPPRLQQVARAWLEATQHVARRLRSRQEERA
ncbi:hypothetical protein CHLNCDRAFT_133978 [Chlorella variabilis]|uniref:Uncharacterized protein n=1 Tax=Chlorella variabilis TaxID=554065 RepID=E1ZEQ1_CHLVA|nr:hypothetical protein CHLNCDRAFT_133978 [Chlorella variabilis]EFN55697.1 hypothetical protein CHLNCDRAFT_133978 [Chlorella variabilis]|eukprot:XP_005847799.1 hypothetical protein CHLNCDRAFT_133978 [Chlorella variabilis]